MLQAPEATLNEGDPLPKRQAAQKSRPHLPFLDGVRALAAIYVVLHHASTNLLAPGAPTAGAWLDYGHAAVDVFIVLSGFSLMLPVAVFGELRGGGRTFIKRRARRILPPYFVALAISAILGKTLISAHTGAKWDVSLPVTKPAILTHLTLTQDLFRSYAHSIDYPMWSVSVETHIYLLFPIVVLAFSRFRSWAVALGSLLIGYGIQGALLRTWVDTTSNGVSPYYLGLFAFGCAASHIAVNQAGRLKWYPAVGAALALAGYFCAERAWHHRLNQPLPEQASSVFVGLAAAATLLALGAGQWPHLRRALSWRPLAWLGTMAYSVYLVHAPVQQIVWQYLVHPMGLMGRREPIALMAIATPLTLVTARLFYLAFERPFMPRSPAAERLAAP